MNWFSIIVEVLPAVVSALTTVARDKGKPVDQVVVDVINHLTPGAPNATALNG
jgi:hypothetical protein